MKISKFRFILNVIYTVFLLMFFTVIISFFMQATKRKVTEQINNDTDRKLVAFFIDNYFNNKSLEPARFKIYEFRDGYTGFFEIKNTGDSIRLNDDFKSSYSSTENADKDEEQRIMNLMEVNRDITPDWFINGIKSTKNFILYSHGGRYIFYDLDNKNYYFDESCAFAQKK
ncbi:MAG: hypothetical protein ACYC4Q_09125 [Victivallaceae bacterium]